MFIYGDDVHSVYGWNAMDVLIDGELQHGRVINVEENGLIIDFQCPERRGQLIEYEKVNRCYGYSGRLTADAQVLLRRHPDGAWIWYAGRLLPVDDYRYDAFEFVEVQRPYGTVRELVPRAQTRQPLADVDEDLKRRHRIEKGEFIIRACPLPATHQFRLFSECQMLGRVFDRGQAGCIGAWFKGVLNNKLLYLHHPLCDPLPADIVENICDKARKKICLAAHPLWPNRVPESSKLRLPPVLLVEIFQSLDSIGRVRCRRVCHLWNALLTTHAHFADVRVSGNSVEYRVEEFRADNLYWVAAGLLKCLRNDTKRAVVSQLWLHDPSGRQLSAPINHILKPGRLPVLVFHECKFGGWMDPIQKVITQTVDQVIQCACERVVVKQCRFPENSLKALVSHHSFNVQSRHQMERQLWDVFERNLVLKKALDRQAVLDWIVESIPRVPKGQVPSDEVKLILQALNEYQSADPRESTRYHQREWTASDVIFVDVRQLTTLTVAFLNEHRQAAI
ncbi:uncharacterized protein LOC129601738 isoform X2 [Paramacrobiotus metropolitanus]|uniref:uncharacterized protein LOC129601738 isoform X2 n=1 Tax=Paramacrobiotus metropolitanus TaxID=2943436 RepID=UPI002445F287|nr:uncharacterized protein LOC129601738 isoform X2 [Paramacrobiotus metropolitanus]